MLSGEPDVLLTVRRRRFTDRLALKSNLLTTPAALWLHWKSRMGPGESMLIVRLTTVLPTMAFSPVGPPVSGTLLAFQLLGSLQWIPSPPPSQVRSTCAAAYG